MAGNPKQDMMFWGAVSLLLCLASHALGGDYSIFVNSGCDFGELKIFHPEVNTASICSKNCDAMFRKTDWKSPPLVKFPNAKPKSNYLLLMLDPDAPNYSHGVFYFHWAVANIPGLDMKTTGDLDKGTTLLNYMGPAPPKGSGQHRYVFLLYEQDTKDRIEVKIEKRARFDLGRWIDPLTKRYPLTGPVAGSQFRVPAE